MIFLGIWVALLGVTIGKSEQFTKQLHVQNTQIRFKSRSNFDNHLRGNTDKKLSSTSSPQLDKSLSHGTSPIQSSNHSSLSTTTSKTPITRSSLFTQYFQSTSKSQMGVSSLTSDLSTLRTLEKSSSSTHPSSKKIIPSILASMTPASSPSPPFALLTSSTTISTKDISTKPTPLMSTPDSPVSSKPSSPFFSTTSSKIDSVTKASTMLSKSNTTLTISTSLSKQTTPSKQTVTPKQTSLPTQTTTLKQTTIPLLRTTSLTSIHVKPTTDKPIQTSPTVITTITPITKTTLSKTENPKPTSLKTRPTGKQTSSASAIVQDTTSTQQPSKTTTTKHPQATKLTTQKLLVTTKTTTKPTITSNQDPKTSTTKNTPPMKSSRTLFTLLSTTSSSKGPSSTLNIRTTKMESMPTKQTEKSSTTQSTSKMQPTVLTTRTTLLPSSTTGSSTTSESATSSSLLTEATTVSTGRSSTSASTQTSSSTVTSKLEPQNVSNVSKEPVTTSDNIKPSTKETSHHAGSSTVNHMQLSSQNSTSQEHSVTVPDTHSLPTTQRTLTNQSQQSSSLSKRSIGAIAAACVIIACVAIIAVLYFYVNRRYKKGGKSWELVDEHSRIETTDMSAKMDIVLHDFDQGEKKSGGETFRPVNHI